MHSASILSTIMGGDFDPILVAPDQSGRATACLRALASNPDAQKMFAAEPTAQHDSYWPADGSWEATYKPYNVKAGILHIPVKGMLLHNFAYAAGSYATGYYYIQKAMERGLADPDVKGIALVCDSPGGHVAGCFELVDRIYAARKIKPIHAFAHEHAYSAAYAIASAAKRITVSRTGGVGSVGVVTMHVSMEKAVAEAGYEITFIYAGKHKIDGNPYQALSEDAKDRIQARIDAQYDVFVATVARNRSMEESKVRKTEALTFPASEAVDRGMADAVGPFDEALAEFQACLATGDMTMTTSTEKPAALTQADVAAAAQAAATAERTRIADIKALDEAKTRPVAAERVALKTGMTVAEAKDFLAGMPEEAKVEAKPAAPAQSNAALPDFKAAMDGTKPGPGATADGDKDKAAETDEERDARIAARILANRFGSPDTASKAKH